MSAEFGGLAAQPPLKHVADPRRQQSMRSGGTDEVRVGDVRTHDDGPMLLTCACALVQPLSPSSC